MSQPLTKTAITLPPFTIPADTVMGPVHLIVRSLPRQEHFYTEGLGFRARRDDHRLELSADGDTPLFVLTENSAATRPPARSTGLYHTAIRVPSRRDLARFLVHLARSGTRLQGASDHLVSEALYLTDPEDNGLEFYHDRPRETWPKVNGSYRLDTLPLDLDSLLAEVQADAAAWTGLEPATIVGHVHLRVADLKAADHFYQVLLGFEQMAAIPEQAGFVSAGGYHHHLGYNIWASRNAPPPPSASTGLDHYTIVLPDAAALEEIRHRLAQADWPHENAANGIRLRDPAANGLLLTTRRNKRADA